MPDDPAPNEYSAAFNRAIGFILPHEEEYARGHWGDENFVVTENVSGDSGGLTKYGIDQASHPDVDIANLTRDQAIAIYWSEWQRRQLDALPAQIATEMFDVWVNGGHAVLWLQHAINQAACAHLAEDGVMGPDTIKAANECDPTAITKIFLQERDARFEAIAAEHPQDQKFLAGWEGRDRDLSQYLA